MATPPPHGKNPNKWNPHLPPWNPPLPPQPKTPPWQQHTHHHHAKKPTKNQRKIHLEPPSKPIGSWSPGLHRRCLHNHGPTQDQYPATTMAPCRHYTTTTQNPLPQIKTPHPHHRTPLQITERGHRWLEATHRHWQHCQPPWQWSSWPWNHRWRRRGSRPRLCWCWAWWAAGLCRVFPWRLERRRGLLTIAESGVEDANVIGVRDAIRDVIGAAAGGRCGCGSGV